jgi:ribosome-binding factor A
VTPAEIKLKRTESVLLELIPEALSALNDARLHELDIIDVRCSRGRSDAKVYIDPAYFSEEEKTFYSKQLKKVVPIVEDYCMKEQGWFKSPKLTFLFDDQMQKSQNIEALFKRIEKEKKDES